MLCKYADKVSCTECKVALFKQCAKFVTAHAKYLAHEICPFKYDPKIRAPFNSVLWSRDANIIKSYALREALRTNTPVRKLSIHQVMSLALASESVDDKVVFIDYTTKLTGDAEKIKGVLVSFIETLVLHKTSVFVVCGPNILFTNDYAKV